MAQTANTPEPTMEEILASIRRIISEDTDEKPAAAKPAAAAAKPAAKAPAPAPVEEDDEDDDVLELTDVVPDEAPAAMHHEPDDVVMVERPPVPRAPTIPQPRFAHEQQLISDRVREQASQHFMQLSRNVMVSEADPRSLESLVQEMLRPVLQNWLNDHLPAMVERMVQEEIERVTRRGRG